VKPWTRRRVQPAPARRPNPTSIAILEHDLFGIAPRPGSAAAVVIALRAVGTCLQHDPADVGALGELPGTRILCCRCGAYLLPDDQGGWRVAEAGKDRQS
jgi:hypothetical protein